MGLWEALLASLLPLRGEEEPMGLRELFRPRYASKREGRRRHVPAWSCQRGEERRRKES